MMNAYLDLLQKHNKLPRIETETSIFDISGYPHYENVCSNVLAFYLDPQREHGLGDLLLISLLDAAKVPADNIRDVKVQREHPTNSGGRLDLLITSRTHVIGIENKIFHHLANDLFDYRDTINQIARERTAAHIVLSPRPVKVQDSTGFKNITYDELWTIVRCQLKYHARSNTGKWLMYLNDFMDTTQRFTEKGMKLELNDMDSFFINNEVLIDKFLADHKAFIAKFSVHVNRLRTLLDNGEQMPPQVTRRWIYDSTCLVHELTLCDNRIALDLYFGPKGWKLQIFGRNRTSHNYLLKLTSARSSENSGENDRFCVKEPWPLDMSLEEIELKLRDWIEWIIKASGGDALPQDSAEANAPPPHA